MVPTITEYLRSKTPGAFRAVPHYVPSGDYLTYFVSDERCHARRLDDVMTIYLSDETEKVIGCKVKGVRHILAQAGSFGVGLDGSAGVRLGLFFFAGAAPDRADRAPAMKWYDLLKEWADVTVDRRQLATA